jgi:hypothetical protein
MSIEFTLNLTPLQGDSLLGRCSTRVKTPGLSAPAPFGAQGANASLFRSMSRIFLGHFAHIA